MFEFNFYNITLTFLILLIFYGIYFGRQKMKEHRHLSLHLPSATKSLWSVIILALNVARKHPKGND